MTEAQLSQDALERWSEDELRKVGSDGQLPCLLTADGERSLLRVPLRLENGQDWVLRRSKGLWTGGIQLDMVWVACLCGEELTPNLFLGIDPAFVYETTRCLLNPRVAQWNDSRIAPIFDIACASVEPIQLTLGFRCIQFMASPVAHEDLAHDQVVMELEGKARIVMAGSSLVLDRVEQRAREFSALVWNARSAWGARLFRRFDVQLFPRQRWWEANSLKALEPGDLLDLENFDQSPQAGGRSVRGGIRRAGRRHEPQMEIFLMMDEYGSNLRMGQDTPLQQDHGGAVSSLDGEFVELEIHAGTTRVVFNDLCTLQEGALIELRDHALPKVTLCLEGNPLMEGELVRFQGQVMVQITRILG